MDGKTRTPIEGFDRPGGERRRRGRGTIKPTLLMALAQLVTSCSGSDDSNKIYFANVTCDSSNIDVSCTSDGICESLATNDTTYIANLKTTCERTQGLFIAGPCPTAGRIGGCADGEILLVYYTSPAMPRTAAEAKQQCDVFAGTFCP